MEVRRLRTRSLDDDDIISRSSYNQYQSAFNSDSECSTPGVSVRDMVKRYNSAANNEQPANINSNKINRISGIRQTIGRVATPLSSHSNSEIIVDEETKACCKNCEHCICCQNRSTLHMKSKATGVGRNGDVAGVSVESGIKSMSLTEERSKLVPHNAERNPTPELDCSNFPSSYQSKTTIAKTSSGVRIIIDIFFDQHYSNVPDIIGNHVETNIPSSRILNEFQQQSLAANKQP